MREIKVISREIESTEIRLLDAKANYADVVIEYINIGYDVSKHHEPEAYRKKVMELVEELNVLYEEHYEATYVEEMF